MKLSAEKMESISKLDRSGINAELSRVAGEIMAFSEKGVATLSDEERKDLDMLLLEEEELHGRVDAIEATESKLKARPSAAPVVKENTWENDPKGGFADSREFMTTVKLASSQDTQAQALSDPRVKRLRPVNANDQHATFDDPAGGLLVPTQFAPDMLSVGVENGVDPIGGRTRRINMTSPNFEVAARVDKDHSTSVTGGFYVTRRPETKEGVATETEFEKVKLRATGLYGLAYVSDEQIEDSGMDIASLIESSMTEEFGAKMTDERLTGNKGAGEMEGVINADCTLSVTRNAASEIRGIDIVKMAAKVWRYNSAVWMATPAAYEQLVYAQLLHDDEAATPTVISSTTMFTQNESIQDNPMFAGILHGRPLLISEFMPALADKGTILCANWSEYLEGTYKPIRNASSMHVRFSTNEMAFKFWMRNAGACWWRSALTLRDGSFTKSPFVVLSANA